MVFTSPRMGLNACGLLAAFVRGAPTEHVDALWQLLVEQAEERLGAKKIWLIIAVGIAACLHARTDSRPKY